MATREGIQFAQEAKDKRYQEYLDLIQKVSKLDWDYNNDPEGNRAVTDRLRTLYGEFGLPEGPIIARGGSSLFNILGIDPVMPGVSTTTTPSGTGTPTNPGLLPGGDYPFLDDDGNPLILSPTGVVTGNPTVGSTEGGDGPPGTYTDRLTYGTGSSGINTLSKLFKNEIKSRTPPRTTPPRTTPTPANNEGIQTLVNTYAPPTDISSQVAAQNVRAGQTNVAAQTLAEQQAATYADMFKPRTTADTTTEDTTTEDTTDVGTGADDTSGGGDPSTDPSTDTGGSGTVVSEDGGVSVGPVVGVGPNTGVSTQDLVNDYIESQGIVTDVLTGVNPEILDYVDNNLNNLNLGIDASISGAMGGTDMGMGGNAQINPLTDRPFSQPFFRPQDIPLMETAIDFMPNNNNFMNSFNPRTDGFGQMPQGFEPMGIETLSNKRGR